MTIRKTGAADGRIITGSEGRVLDPENPEVIIATASLDGSGLPWQPADESALANESAEADEG
jgi:hypothetical protein